MAHKGRKSFPGGDLGFTRGSDFLAGGSGSGMGTVAQGGTMLGQGLGPLGNMGNGNGGPWEPSVLYLFGLLIGEMIVFHVLSRILK